MAHQASDSLDLSDVGAPISCWSDATEKRLPHICRRSLARFQIKVQNSSKQARMGIVGTGPGVAKKKNEWFHDRLE
jgi:hypothetical protein